MYEGPITKARWTYRAAGAQLRRSGLSPTCVDALEEAPQDATKGAGVGGRQSRDGDTALNAKDTRD